ncbi:oxalate/formate antiporter family transporter [Solibacillus isronensis B3W22]|uniref:Oxalate/formate antiporter family transporter n=1 Tax=Solibacillus isronensis B3W22 TaxID=1224748 RepID=K1KV63_9BACL|nr:MFS transporter [Solibacillus isronensis]AMO85769.1 MFS transporter [Solibacillus silvestris]EKB46421.1 oxalate/formate antiporter family transporter [Solibacillus isronensis B3W22]
MERKQSNIHYAWWILVGLCIIIGVSKGALNNSASLFLTPVSNELGIGMGNLSLYLSISAIVTLVFLPFAGKLVAKYDIRMLIIIAIILQAGSFVAFSFMNSVWGWYIFALPLAVGGTFITVILGPVLINQWFKKRSGLALGILAATGGVIGAIVQPIVGKTIVSEGWRFSYVAVGVSAIIFVIIATVVFIKKMSKEKGLYPYGTGDTEGGDQSANNAATDKGVTLANAKKSSAFYALLTFFFLITAIASFMMHIPTYIVTKGFSQEFAGSAMGVYMLGVVFASLIIGVLNDKIGTKNTTILSMILGMASIFIFLYAASSSVMIFVALILFAFVTSGIGIIAPSLTSSLFGNKEYGQIYSTVSLGLAIASIVAIPAYGYIFQFTGSYSGGLYTILAMLAINIVAVIIAYKGKEKLEKAGLWN